MSLILSSRLPAGTNLREQKEDETTPEGMKDGVKYLFLVCIKLEKLI